MTNLAHWHDDIDDALIGDFDGSLSNLCIMSLSFDFSRNGAYGAHFNSYNRDSTNPTSAIISNNNNNNNSSSIVATTNIATTTTTSSHTSTASTTTAITNTTSSTSFASSSNSSNNRINSKTAQDAADDDNNEPLHCNNYAKQLSSSTLARLNMNQDTLNEYSMHAFKRFKSSLAVENSLDDESNKSNNSTKSNHHQHMQQVGKSATTTVTANVTTGQDRTRSRATVSPPAPQSPDILSDRPDDPSSPDDSTTTRTSLSDPRSPSRSRSCSSISTQSHTITSRSQSPSDMSLHNNHINNNNNSNNNNNNSISNNSSNNKGDKVNDAQRQANGRNESGPANNDENDEKDRVESKEDAQVSNFSVRESLLNSQKDATYSASGAIKSATTPMHFKGIHHPFSIRQFPSSPYHQFSNSSFNHDFYDRYLSHDSHQPLQTPLIGIERTQDLLSLKLPAHGPDDADSQKFPKDWPFDEPNKSTAENHATNQHDRATGKHSVEESSRVVNYNMAHQSSNSKRKDFSSHHHHHVEGDNEGHKDFQFSYKSSQRGQDSQRTKTSQGEPMDLNISYEQTGPAGCCGGNNGDQDDDKDDMFNQSMRHFNPNRAHMSNSCCDSLRGNATTSTANASNKQQSQPDAHDSDVGSGGGHETSDRTNVPASIQYQNSQESMFGIDSSKQKFQYALAAPISVATKFNEDTMTYLNQGQAYEIKLENMTDESKKGFMCSIINIGFHERHMQQAENELWQQWSQQHPNEKIFSVDMKLSYNVFGVESDGLNKCEFLWDSSKVAGVFIRINSISTEFTPRKHGGEKGVPFKLSIETFSYNSKTHDSYFISAACCQIKVFKPKGAERKIRSDRDKISKRPLSEQEKYHRPCDQTIFRECSLTSLHPLADSSLCYYRHSHGHFASKQVGAVLNINSGASTASNMQQNHQTTNGHGQSNEQHDNNAEQASDGPQSNQSSDEPSPPDNDNNKSCRTRTIDAGQPVHDEASGSQRAHEFETHSGNRNSINDTMNRNQQHNQNHHHNQHIDHYISSQRPIANTSHCGHRGSNNQQQDTNQDNDHGSTIQHHNQANSNSMDHFGHHSNDVINATSSLNHIYQSSQGRASFAGINNGQHFGISYHGHTSPSSLTSHMPTHPNYSLHGSANSLNSMPHSSHSFHPLTFQQPAMATVKGYGRQLTTTIHDKGTAGSSGTTNPNQCQIGAGSSSGLKSSNSPPVTTNTSANNNNYTAHINIHTDQPCIRQQVDHHQKDGPGAYHSDSAYESHLHQHLALNTNAAHNNQHLTTTCRQRSASTSIAPASAHCTSYMNGHGQTGRHQDGYHLPAMPSDNSMVDGQGAYSNHWPNGSQQLGISSIMASNRSSCLPPNNQDTGYHHNQSGNNYSPTTVNHGYDSDHTSTPHKSHQISESPLSCCAKQPARANSYEFSADPQKMDRRNTSVIRITANSTHSEVNSWFLANRFNNFAKTFNNFSGSDLLRLAKSELIDICGLIDGIRLYNCLHEQPIRPRRVLYVSLEDCDVFQPIYLYELTMKELVFELTNMCNLKYYNKDSMLIDEKPVIRDKSSMNSSSSSDSRSSMGAVSTEAGVDDAFGITEQYFNDRDRFGKRQVLNRNQKTPERGSCSISCQPVIMKRLLIDGLTSVKILATEQVIQMLDNDSAWILTLMSREPSGCTVACLTACRPKQFPSK